MQRLFEHYNLGTYLRHKEIKEGVENSNFKVRTTKGGYFVKKYASKFKPGYIRRVNQVLVEIGRDPSLPVAPPFFTKDGDSLVLLDGEVYCVYPFVKGEPYFLDETFTHDAVKHLNAARVLARLHRKVVSLPPRMRNRFSFDKVNEIKSLWGKFLVEIEKKDMRYGWENKLVDIIYWVRDLFLGMEQEFKKLKKGGRLLYGDYHAFQLKFTNKEVAAVLDFDLMEFGPVEYDVTSSSMSFVRDYWGYDLKRMKEFIEAYMEVNGELDLDAEKIILWLVFATIDTICFYVRLIYEDNTVERNWEMLYYHLNGLKWIMEHQAEFYDVFQKH